MTAQNRRGIARLSIHWSQSRSLKNFSKAIGLPEYFSFLQVIQMFLVLLLE